MIIAQSQCEGWRVQCVFVYVKQEYSDEHLHADAHMIMCKQTVHSGLECITKKLSIEKNYHCLGFDAL